MAGGADARGQQAFFALGHFQRGEYNEALALLRPLLRKDDDDDRPIRHNIAVTEYHRDRAAAVAAGSPAALAAAAEALQNKLDMMLAPATTAAALDATTAYALYNLAAIALQRHDLPTAAAALARLQPYIDTLNDLLGLRTCFLLLEVYLRQDRLSETAALLARVERTYAGLLATDGRRPSAGDGPAHLRAASSGGDWSDSEEPSHGDGGSGGPPSGAAGNTSRDGSEGGVGSAEAGGSGRATAGGGDGGSGGGGGGGGGGAGRYGSDRAVLEDAVTERNARLLLHMYKARLHLRSYNVKAAKREIKAALTLNHQSAPAIFLKAHMEALRGSYRKAAKLLNAAYKAAQGSGEPAALDAVQLPYHCDLGCLYQRVGMDGAAAYELAAALLGCQPAAAAAAGGSTGMADAALAVPAAAEVVYNLAVQLLHLRRPVEAYRLLRAAAPAHTGRPLFWLRAAETCILAHEQQVRGCLQGSRQAAVQR